MRKPYTAVNFGERSDEDGDLSFPYTMIEKGKTAIFG